MNRAIFLDRDGVINEPIMREGKPCSPRSVGQFRILPGIGRLLEESRRYGFINVVITNQPELARHLIDPATLEAMHRKMRGHLAIDDVMICPHDDGDACSCRKPRPGMLVAAAQKWDVDLHQSFLIGDRRKDIEAGRAVGCRTILLDYPHNQGVEADFRVSDPELAWAAIRSCISV